MSACYPPAGGILTSFRIRPPAIYAYVLLLVGSLGGAGPASATEPRSLTLEQAIASIESVNLNVLLSREALLQATAQAQATRAGILPIVTASAQQRRSKTVTVNSTTTTSSAPFNRFDGVITGNYSLVDPARWSAVRSANVGIDVLQADYNATLQLIIASIANRYFAHLRNLRRLDVLDANIARARSLLELAQNQLRAGTASQIDVTRAEAQLAQTQQARLQQETVDYQSEMALKRALNLDSAQSLQLQDVTLRRIDLGALALDDPSIYERRADYLRAKKAVEQARIDVRTATFERLPTLALAAQFGDAAPRLTGGQRKEQWFAGGIISVPIFDGLRAGADRQLALSRRRAQEIRLHDLEQQISAEIRVAAQDTNSRNAQIALAEKTRQLAQDQLRLAQQRYQQGVADNREIVEAQTQLAVAEDSWVEAGYQYNLSRVELARARGDVRMLLQEKTP